MFKIPRIKVKVLQEQRDKLISVFESGELMLGGDLDLFETKLKQELNQDHCILTVNGFSAIVLAIHALNIRGKNILMPAISTCFAISNAIRASGNVPVFTDVEASTGNLDSRAALVLYNETGYDLMITPNHFGIASAIKELKSIGVPVIEDCAQSFLTNSHRNSEADMQVCSFYPTKIINAIDGGAILTRNKIYADNIRDRVYYEQQERDDEVVRFNFRMPNIHASIGLLYLSEKETVESRYKQIINQYKAIIQKFDTISLLENTTPNDEFLYKFVLCFENNEKLDKFMSDMMEAGIEGSKEILAIVELTDQFPNAQKLYQTTCSIPLYEELTNEEVELVCSTMENSISA